MGRRVNNVISLSPDGSGRFLMMFKLLEALHSKLNRPIEILDVGGSSPYMSRQLKTSKTQYKLTTIDILPKPKGFSGTYITGDATEMPLKSESFDTVITTDVLEHIPDDKKEAFIRECIRVARDFVILAAPFNTEGVDEVEHATNNLNLQLFQQGQNWLEEHFKYKKPELSDTIDTVKRLGYDLKVIGTNNIYNWLLATHTNLMEAKIGLGSEAQKNANRALNNTLLHSFDMSPPYYRHFVVIFKSKATKLIKAEIDNIAKPHVTHSSTIKYYHELLSTIANRLGEIKNTADEEINQLNQVISEKQKEIDRINFDLNQKQIIIDRCGPYLKLLKLVPGWVKKGLRSSSLDRGSRN